MNMQQEIKVIKLLLSLINEEGVDGVNVLYVMVLVNNGQYRDAYNLMASSFELIMNQTDNLSFSTNINVLRFGMVVRELYNLLENI